MQSASLKNTFFPAKFWPVSNFRVNILDFSSSTYEDTIILNIANSNATDIYTTDYVSIILKNNLIISIIPENIDLFNDRNLAAYSQKTYTSLRFFIFNILAIKLLSKSNVNMSTARIRLQKLDQAMEKESQEISSLDLMSCERDINQLSDIIEDQYIGFEIFGFDGCAQSQ